MRKSVLTFITKINKLIMLKQYSSIIVFLVLGALNLKAQDTLPTYQSKAFRSLDISVGRGLTYPKFYPIPVSIVYQQNIKRGLSWISLSQFYAQFKGDESLNESYKSVNWVEAVGIGGTLGNKWFNTGLYLVGGGRFYHSKLTLDNSAIFHEPTLVTSKLNPELGLLYNLKIGKKKLYFTSQVYASVLPFKNFTANLHTF
jgi:hypothetical protein